MKIKNLLNNDVTQEEFLNYYNATISYEKLPSRINGCVFNYRGIYNIFINKNLSHKKRKKTILHELIHIELSHLEQYDNDMFALKVENYEDEADTYMSFLSENI